ncbi:hypothetical protein JQS43_00330 [Natronosporangium hydrolyticum]|uniref:Uncharacterized protein n=1 Tax=Natronosporangium hydrolyticum TaxID=2811111 RepID=A0A895YBR6_9ACTN|nr:hypothetical protein [Natronosporangium hydrolyticum]QSB14881.1 hypothetical protein JQS43_00330 [Natronosporangium hydrolyticum]
MTVEAYQPMTIARLGELLATCAEQERWLMISEFLEEHRHEPRPTRLALLAAEPATTGDERWDVFLAALAEHLAAKDDRRGPAWCEQRHLYQFWFPFNTPAARVEAIVHAPAAFRRRGVMLARNELESA